MPTLHKYLHVIVFIFLLAHVAMLNLGPLAVGWPIAIHSGQPNWIVDPIVRTVVNILPCMMVLSLCMIPFSYDSKRSFSVSSILVLTVAVSISLLILTPAYLKTYQTGEHLLIIVTTAFAVNGLLVRLLQVLSDNIDLPQWKKPDESNGNELDFD